MFDKLKKKDDLELYRLEREKLDINNKYVMYGFGSRGPQVIELQKKLRAVLNLTPPVDGIFGNDTQFMVKEFQRQNNMDVDGYVTPKMMMKLDQVYASKECIYNIPKSTLKFGFKGEEVMILQRLLKHLGYTGIDNKELLDDGVFGKNTRYAVKRFQLDNKIVIDGVYCHKCEALLYRKLHK